MLNKRIIVIVVFILICTSFQAATKTQLQSYFIDSESDISIDSRNNIMVRSFETKVYTLDMLYTNTVTRRLFFDLDLKCFYKKEKMEIDLERKNKYGLIIDLNKAKHSTLEIYKDSSYMEYFRNVDRSEILTYLTGLNERNKKNIPAFIIESASYFNNKEFYSAYADYLQQKSKTNNDELINLYLHGGDFISASNLLDKSKKYSNSQKVNILELAQKYNEAYELCLKMEPKNQKRLSQLAWLSGKNEVAYQHFLHFDPNAHQILAQLSYATGDFKRALVHARQNPMSDEFMLDLFVKTNNNYEAFFLAVKTNSSISDSLFSSLSEFDKARVSDYYADKGEFIFAYELRKKANLHQNMEQSLQEGLDAQLENFAKDPKINLKGSVEAALGTKTQSWSKESARIVVGIVKGTQHDLGYYYDLCDKNELAFQYYLDTHQYIKAIDYHQLHLQNTNIPISEIAYTRAGIEAEYKNQNELAISYYKLGGPANYQRISELYRTMGDYDQAISYQLKTDPNANQTLAELYEKKGSFQYATEYYRKAGMYTKALDNTLKIIPKNYSLLIDINQSLGNKAAVTELLNEYYSHDYLGSGAEYVKALKTADYIAKVVADKRYDSIERYNLYSEISTNSLVQLIEDFPVSGSNTIQKKILDERLRRYVSDLEDLNLEEISEAIKLADRLKDTGKKATLVKKQNEEKARIAKEEKEEKARIANEERLQKMLPSVAGKYVLRGSRSGTSPKEWYIEFTEDGNFYEYMYFLNSPCYNNGTYEITSVGEGGKILLTLYGASMSKYGVKGRYAYPLKVDGQKIGLVYEKVAY